MSINPSNVQIVDGLGNVQLIRSDQSTLDNSQAFHHVIELAGTDVSSSNPLPVSDPAVLEALTTTGSVGIDYSANAPAIPSGNLLSTIPASASRYAVEVQNQSAGIVQLVLDDGLGNSPGSVILAGASTNGGQGGGWSSTAFKGRVQIFGLSSSSQQIFARVM